MVLRRAGLRPRAGLTLRSLRTQLQAARARVTRENIAASIRGFLSREIEGLLGQASSQRERVVRKPSRLQPREDRISAPVATTSIFRRAVTPILQQLGLQFITGSGTFTAQELARAEYGVFFHTEAGFYAEMRLAPNERPLYAKISAEEADLLRQDMPPPELIARLFTPTEPIDN